MISFKQFIHEEWEKPIEGEDGQRIHHHNTNVSGHHVQVTVHRQPHWYDTRGNHNVSFKVNGSLHHGEAGHKPTEAGMHILKHVHKTINDFVETHKPRVMSFSATDGSPVHRHAKDKLYGALAKKIAHAHGGEHTSKFMARHGIHDHTIEFKK